MNAVVLRELGEPENLRLEELPEPRPGGGEVIVELAAAALNRRDVWIRRGKYAGIKLPIILGSDGAGRVAEAGPDVDRTLVGREVVINPGLDWGSDPRVQSPAFRILGLPDDGTYAERVKVPASNVFPKPAHLTFEEAAALPLAGLTAYRAVVTRARVQRGETVLVTGIGGGVAAFALQIATRLGARVLVTSTSAAKRERAHALGAAGSADTDADDWPAAIKSLTGGRGADVVIDSVGGETFAKALDAVRPGGRVVTYGATTGAAPIEVRRIFFKQLDVLGTTMGAPADFEAMIALYASDDQLRPPIDTTFPLQEAAAAHRRMEAREQFGKIVLRVA